MKLINGYEIRLKFMIKKMLKKSNKEDVNYWKLVMKLNFISIKKMTMELYTLEMNPRIKLPNI
jgi:hypothetical protein